MELFSSKNKKKIAQLEKVNFEQLKKIKQLERMCTKKDSDIKKLMSDGLRHGSTLAGKYMSDRKKNK